LAGAALASLATIMVVWGSSNLGSPEVGVLIRVAGILLAVSLVVPSLRKPSMTTLLFAGTGLVLVMLRPGLIWAALLGWVGWVLFSRQANTTDNAS
jgi:drug/metabolite transporter (DMT)-like permease